MAKADVRERTICAVAPIRICDIGGWTDTWFAGYGAVFNIAVYPYVEVQLRVRPRDERPRVTISLENYGDAYSVEPGGGSYGKHPLIEAALEMMPIPEEVAVDVNIYSMVPPGASTGTSASVSVALIGALDQLSAGRLTPYEVAALAHRVETEKLRLQSGIQDQMASAYGGICYIQMHAFPHASVSQIEVSNSIWWELEHRLALVYIGRPHSSSDVHRRVIADLGQDAATDPRLSRLRKLAAQAKDAVYAGDFVGLAEAMNQNTSAQAELHPDLVSTSFQQIMDIGRTYGGEGFKVNGAGGDGGSITILTDGDMATKRALLADLRGRGYSAIDIYLSRHGLRVW